MILFAIYFSSQPMSYDSFSTGLKYNSRTFVPLWVVFGVKCSILQRPSLLVWPNHPFFLEMLIYEPEKFSKYSDLVHFLLIKMLLCTPDSLDKLHHLVQSYFKEVKSGRMTFITSVVTGFTLRNDEVHTRT